jgi:methylamine dehydrogenase accessory protein MauD
MSSAWIVSNLLLWAAVVGLAAVVVALLRQIGVLHERIAPVGALVGGERPQVGEKAPVLELEGWSGETVRVGDRRAAEPPGPGARGTLLFFVSPTCPVCKTLLPHLDSIRRAEGDGVQVVLASDGAREEHEAFVRAHALERGHYVLSEMLGRAYQVGRLPYAILIDADGVVRARGLVNTREHLESLFQARELGVASVQEYVARAGGTQRVA